MNETETLGDALFTATQQKVLGLLYGTPDRSFYTNEIVRWAGVGKGGVTRELERLRRAGVVTVARQGNQTHYQANPACPIYPELIGIVRKTFGIAEPLRQALQPLAGQIAWAFVFGSMAKGDAHARSDVDLMLIGDGLVYGEVMALLMPLEPLLGRPVNPTLYSLEDWRARREEGNSFVVRVLEQPRIPVMGRDPMESGNDDGPS